MGVFDALGADLLRGRRLTTVSLLILMQMLSASLHRAHHTVIISWLICPVSGAKSSGPPFRSRSLGVVFFAHGHAATASTLRLQQATVSHKPRHAPPYEHARRPCPPPRARRLHRRGGPPTRPRAERAGAGEHGSSDAIGRTAPPRPAALRSAEPQRPHRRRHPRIDDRVDLDGRRAVVLPVRPRGAVGEAGGRRRRPRREAQVRRCS